MKKSMIVRLILTAALLYGVYTETGIWTTILAFLLALHNEALAFVLKKKGILQ